MSLRERKTALSRKNLLDALLKKLESQDLDEIKISELCDFAMVSQASFYNWFPKKTDLLVYYIQLWTLEAQWQAKHQYQAKQGLETIEAVFRFTAHKTQKQPRIMAEIAAFQFKGHPEAVFRPLNSADIEMNFSEHSGVEQFQSMGLNSILPVHLEHAKRCGHIQPDTDLLQTARLISSLFFGAPAMLQEGEDLEQQYLYQLGIIWNGLKP